MAKKEPLKLIPLDELKAVVAKLAAVPKEAVEKAGAEQHKPKRKRTKKS